MSALHDFPIIEACSALSKLTDTTYFSVLPLTEGNVWLGHTTSDIFHCQPDIWRYCISVTSQDNTDHIVHQKGQISAACKSLSITNIPSHATELIIEPNQPKQ